MQNRALAVACLLPLSLAAQSADLVVQHARIYTQNAAQPRASAIAVRKDRIVYVGDDASRWIGPATRQIDAHGAALLPGLIDSHGHLASLGQALESLDLRGMTSEAAIAAKVRLAAAQHRPGEWIRGGAWDQNLFAGKQFPTAEALDQAAPDNPVYLSRVDGHAAWVNHRALNLADVNAATPDPPGGKVIRDAAGRPTGVLVDAAKSLVSAKIPPPTVAEVERHLERGARECARLGLTTVHDAGVGALELEADRALIAQHRLPVRVYAMLGVSEGAAGNPLWLAFQKRGPEIGEYLTVRSLKLYADGALGSRGAALLAPYSDEPGNTGLLISSEAFIRKTAEEAVRAGFQVNTHAIGDRANRLVLNAYAAALGGRNNYRFRVEHAQVVAPEDFERFRQYSVQASMQPTHATSDMPWAEARLGPQRVRGAYAWRRFLDLGVALPLGSDFPVESPNPLWGFYAAITRQDHAGNPAGGWYPDQRLTREEALRGFTLAGAYAAFQEKDRGSLETGKLADFVMLSDDIMQAPAAAILKTRVTLTVLGGEIVYSSQ